MDREHPIPQEVSTYEFRLVGDMTIKQFMQVAAGALISLVIYSSNMEPYVKWPLILISFLSGIALAFFPIEDRPLSKWIVLFVKAIYSPTIYLWDKHARKHDYFLPETDESLALNSPIPSNIPNVVPLPQPEVQSQTTPDVEDDRLDQQEQEFLSKVSEHFTEPTATTNPSNIAQVAETSSSSVVANNTSANSPAITNPSSSSHEEVKIPDTTAPAVDTTPKQEVYVAPPTSSQPQSSVGGEITPLATNIQPRAQAATFSVDASPPTPPTMPNIIVGQVLTPEGNIVDGAILEIKDEQGRSVRALRSNRLGHFMIVTPLVSGKYSIDTEKEGYQFEPVSFSVEDKVIPPIAIWAKNTESRS